MPDLAITDLVINSLTRAETIQLGEACAANDIVHLDNEKYWLSVATDANKSAATHILVQGGAVDAFVLAIPLRDQLGLTGAVLTGGVQYVLSATPGKVAPKSDLIAPQLVTNLFVGPSSGIVITWGVQATGIPVS